MPHQTSFGLFFFHSLSKNLLIFFSFLFFMVVFISFIFQVFFTPSFHSSTSFIFVLFSNFFSFRLFFTSLFKPSLPRRFFRRPVETYWGPSGDRVEIKLDQFEMVEALCAKMVCLNSSRTVSLDKTRSKWTPSIVFKRWFRKARASPQTLESRDWTQTPNGVVRTNCRLFCGVQPFHPRMNCGSHHIRPSYKPSVIRTFAHTKHTGAVGRDGHRGRLCQREVNGLDGGSMSERSGVTAQSRVGRHAFHHARHHDSATEKGRKSPRHCRWPVIQASGCQDTCETVQSCSGVHSTCAPFQLALSTSAGVDCVEHAVTAATDENPSRQWCPLMEWERANYVCRRVVVAELRDTPSLQGLVTFLRSCTAGRHVTSGWKQLGGVMTSISTREGAKRSPHASAVQPDNPRCVSSGARERTSWRGLLSVLG